MSATITIILDTRRMKKKTNTYPVKLRVISEREIRYYPTIFNLSQEAYKKLAAPRISEELQSLRKKLNDLERSAKNAVDNLDPFTFLEFEKSFITDHPILRKRNKEEPVPPSLRDDFDFTPFFKKFPS